MKRITTLAHHHSSKPVKIGNIQGTIERLKQQESSHPSPHAMQPRQDKEVKASEEK